MDLSQITLVTTTTSANEQQFGDQKMFLQTKNRTKKMQGQPMSNCRRRTSKPTLRWLQASRHRLVHLYLQSSFLLVGLLVALAYGQFDGLNFNGSNNNNNNAGQTMTSSVESNSPQHQEIMVHPNSQVRIECKLPSLEKHESRSYYWNFIGSGQKRGVICFEAKCPEASNYGIELEINHGTSSYDLIINNATYELNDGLYDCVYVDTNPESKQTITKGNRLTVLIPPQPPTIVPVTPLTAHEGQEHQLSCLSHGGNPEPNITWFRNDQPLIQAPGLRVEQSRVNGSTTNTLSWIPTLEDHQAVYKCAVWNKAMNTMQPYESLHKLLVEYAPRITVGPHNPLKVLQGTQATLSCKVDAYPAVKGIRWYKDGHLISNQFNMTIGEAKISDASVYSCQADNGIAAPMLAGLSSAGNSNQLLAGSDPASQLRTATAVEAQLHLQVLYPPRVRVHPTRALPLNEGDSIAFNCSADAFPPAHEFIWTKQDDPNFRKIFPSSSSAYLEFGPVSAADGGNYTCTAINRMEPSVGAGQPQPFHYLHHQQQQQQQQAAVERSSSASALVQVRHKPGVAEILLGSGGETELGTKTQIVCRARPPGFPEPQYKYWKYQGSSNQRNFLSKQHPGPSYSIYAARQEDEARYGCVAFNEIGSSSEAEGELIVNEPPVVIRDKDDNGSQVQGFYPYEVTLRATGKPMPKVSWFHRSPVDGRRIELNPSSLSEFHDKFSIETSVQKTDRVQLKPTYNVYTTLKFKRPLEVDDRGRYWVEFNNGVGKPAIGDYQLHVNHMPIPAPRNQPVLSQSLAVLQQQPTRWKAGFNVGESVNLTCRVSAYPKPEFVWFSKDDTERPIEVSSRYKITTSNPIDDIWESSLSFSHAQSADYGEYMCVTATHDQANVKLGDSVQIFISLSPKTKPDPPTSLEIIETTQDSLTIQWLPGFDGGFAQNQYLIQYAPDDGSGASLSKRFGPSADLMGSESLDMPNSGYSSALEQGLVLESTQTGAASAAAAAAAGGLRMFDCLSMNPCTINQLQPRQTYVFRLRAKNEKGASDFSPELRATTRANISQIPKILDAWFDASNNSLHLRIEPGMDYLLNNLNARIETHTSGGFSQMGAAEQQQQAAQNLGSDAQENQPTDGRNVVGQNQRTPSGVESAQVSEWRLHLTVPVLHELSAIGLKMQKEVDQLRVTLCSRSNDSLCGPEYPVGMASSSSFFNADQRGLSLSILISTLALIVLLGGLATTMHSCCLSRKNKKAEAIERADPTSAFDNKPGSHGSTTSTNSTTANGTSGQQSMDNINGVTGGTGSASDHSSDHSRQAKLDSMLPPNYNHYADRASIMMEQQQLMQQQQQAGLMATGADKLSSPFNNALLSVASQQQQQQQIPSPMANGSLNYFNYSQALQLDPQQQQSLSLEQHASMMDGGGGLMTLGANGLEEMNQQQPDGQQQQMWTGDYGNNYNALGYVNQAQQDQMIDPTYGTTGSVIMSQQSAAYDNSANSGQYYLSAYQQQQQQHYQQEMQQQMYGTLTRAGYQLDKSANSSSLDQQQQQQQQQHYTTANGLVQPLPPPPPPQESDYGTTGGRSGRLIREIIV